MLGDSNSPFFENKNNKFALLLVAVSILYPVGFVIIFCSSDTMIVNALICSLIHSFCAAMVMYRVVSRSLLRRKLIPYMATVFILINLLYFSASSIKYFEPELYPGFVQDNMTRLIYSLISLAVLWISYEIIVRFKRRRYRLKNFTIHSQFLINFFIMIMLLLIVTKLFTLYRAGFGYSYHLNLDPLKVAMARTALPLKIKFLMWIDKNAGYLLILLLSLYFQKGTNKKFFFWVIFFYFMLSLFSGSRGELFSFSLGLLFALTYLYGFGRKMLSYIFFSGPIIIFSVSVVILLVSGRVGVGDYGRMKHQLVYRFDLTDYAATLLSANGALSFHLGIINDAIYYATPKFILPSKYESNQQRVLDQLTDAGLDKYLDYTDTFFSIGAQLGGLAGFLLVPFAMIMFLYLLEQLFYRGFGSAAKIIIVIMSPLYLRIETDLNSLFADWRMLPIYIIFGLLFYWLFTKKYVFAADCKVKP